MKPISSILNVLRGSSGSFQISRRAENSVFLNSFVRQAAPENQAPQTQEYNSAPQKEPSTSHVDSAPHSTLSFFSSFCNKPNIPIASVLIKSEGRKATDEKGIIESKLEELKQHLTSFSTNMDRYNVDAFFVFVESSFNEILGEIPSTIAKKLENETIFNSLEKSYTDHFGFRISKNLDQLIQGKLAEAEKTGEAQRKALSNFINEKNEDGVKQKTLLLREIAETLSKEETSIEALDKMHEGWVQSALQRAIMSELDLDILQKKGHAEGLLFKSLRKNALPDQDNQKEQLKNTLDQIQKKIDTTFDDELYKALRNFEQVNSTSIIYTKDQQLIDHSFANKTAEDALKKLNQKFLDKHSLDAVVDVHSKRDTDESAETQNQFLFETPDSGDESDTDSDIIEPEKNKTTNPLLTFIKRDVQPQEPLDPSKQTSSGRIKFDKSDSQEGSDV